MVLSAEGICVCTLWNACLPMSTTASVSTARKVFIPLKVCWCRIFVMILATCGVNFVRSPASLVVIFSYVRLTWIAASNCVHSLSVPCSGN